MIKLSRSRTAFPLRAGLALTCALCALAACSQQGSSSNPTADATGAMDNSLAAAPPPVTALPLATGPVPASRPAPVASALPPAPSAPLGSVPPADQYAYLNQAYAFSQSLADAPPDYSYDYQGEAPWVWQSPDGYSRVAERLPLGVRYFYYAPGASTPYLIQDPQYAYGYSNGRLAAVYGADGRVLPYDVEARQARAAGIYLAWAAGLYAAARHEAHVAVSQARWEGERQAVYADQARWRQAQQRNAAWATYSQAHPNDQAHWADQRYARAAEAARFAQAVNDRAALAHAQQAAAEAHAIPQSHGERPPGPAPQGGFGRRELEGAPVRGPRPTATDLAGAQHQQALQRPQAAEEANAQAQARERAAMQAQAAAASQHQIETHHADQGLAQARAQQQEAAQAQAQARQAQAHDQQAAARQAEAAAAGRAASDRAAADAHRQAAEQAQAQAERNAQASAEHGAPQPPAHAEPAPAPAPPHPQAPPAKGKPRPDEPPR